jgi:hypothetical protein
MMAKVTVEFIEEDSMQSHGLWTYFSGWSGRIETPKEWCEWAELAHKKYLDGKQSNVAALGADDLH